MRIVYVAYHGSIHTRRWVGFFAARGHEVHVVTCGGGDAVDHDLEGSVIGRNWRVHDLGAPRMGKLGYLVKVRAVRSIIRSLQPDIVHAHWLTSYGLLARSSGVEPLVVTAHGDDVLIAPRRFWMRWLIRWVLGRASLVTVPSEQMREAVEQLLPRNASPRIEVFQYGVDVARLAEIGESIRMEHHQMQQAAPLDSLRPVRLISTRALLDIYRLDVLIDAVTLLERDGLDVRCDVVGDGPQRAELEQRVRAAGLEDVITFYGHVDGTVVEQMVASADVYISVAESDGLSLSLLEAMCLGAVPVVSNIPANRGWVNDGHTGVLVEIDPSSLAGGITRALELDPWRVARDNVAIVAERADMSTNLTACEEAMDEIVGLVQWDPHPVRPDQSDGVDAA
jgi:glycosyltransferase involved in cell wall biosynthesis